MCYDHALSYCLLCWRPPDGKNTSYCVMRSYSCLPVPAGVVAEENPYDKLQLTATIPSSDPLFQQKRAMLQPAGMATQQTFDLFAGKVLWCSANSAVCGNSVFVTTSCLPASTRTTKLRFMLQHRCTSIYLYRHTHKITLKSLGCLYVLYVFLTRFQD